MGNYTLLSTGDPDASISPDGDGFGTANANAAGSIKFTDSLGDEKKGIQIVSLSQDGH